MNIVYFGSGQFGIDCLEAIKNSQHNLASVVTSVPHPAGRGRKPAPTAVAKWADDNSIAIIETENVNDLSVIETIRKFQPDLIVVIAFGQKVSKELTELPPKSSINVHASLLPKYRGAAPINWAIINGEKQTGISVIKLAEKMDAGDILAQQEADIAADETAGQLHERLAKLAAPLLLKTINQIAGGSAVYTVQDDSHATKAPKLKKSDGILDFSESAEVLKRKIVGFWPWPGAASDYVSKQTEKPYRVTIAAAQVVESANPGGLAAGVLDEELNVICGENALRITKIKPAGGKPMDFKDFVNGRDTKPGASFIKPKL
jgi:methionyl-tRNA formyltransferase